MRVPKGLILAGGLGAVQALLGGVTAAAATVDAATSIPLTVVTSTGEPVVGVFMTAADETQPNAPPRGCGSDEITTTDTAGQCTFFNMTVGHLYSIWLQGYPITGSGDVRPPHNYQPIILKVTGRQVTPPAPNDDGAPLRGRALTSSGEYIPGIGVCSAGGSFGGGVTCVTADAQGNYNIPRGCCDVRLMGYLADGGGPYVNGSVRHAPTGAPATIVVQVGSAAVAATPTPTAAPTVRAATGTLAQTGSGVALSLLLLAAIVMLGGVVTLAWRR